MADYIETQRKNGLKGGNTTKKKGAKYYSKIGKKGGKKGLGKPKKRRK